MVNDTVRTDNKNEIKLCLSKLSSLLRNKDIIDKMNINQILDDLNLIDITAVNLNDKLVCIRLCCSLITPYDVMLTGKCSQVITKFVQDERLSEQMIAFIIEWCLRSLTESPDIAQIETLTAMENILVQNVNSCKMFIDDLLKVLKNPLENKTKLINPGEIFLQRLSCIHAIVPLMSNVHFQIVKDVLIQFIQMNLNFESSVKSKIILLQIEILLVLSERSPSWLLDNIGVILGICLSFASYGLPHHIESIPLYLLPTPLLYSDNKSNIPKLNKKSKNRRKQKKNVTEKIKLAPLDDHVIQDINWSQTSESDFSDSEMGRSAFLKKSERKIRLSSLSLLLHIVKTINKKELIGYWNNILSGPYSILKTLSTDTSPRSRVSVTSILTLLFSSSKIFLSQAQHLSKRNNLPYVSWSHLLADLIETTHINLCDVISQPQSVGSLLSSLQCLIIILRNTPYHRLNEGILKKVVQCINPHLKHLDCNIRISAIKCLTEIVIFEPNIEEQILLMRHVDVNEFSKSSTDSWILSYCIESIKNENLGITIRAECWSLLGFLIKHHFMNIGCSQRLSEILHILQRDLEDNNIVIQHKAAKAFEQIAVPLSLLDISCGIDVYKIWFTMLQGPLVPMLQSTIAILASAAADCIANISASIFEKLPKRLRIFVMTALCGCTAHEEHTVRSAAVRTLGTIIVFPFLSENIQIIYDVADRIATSMNDENLNVRAKAAWALGNLSDVLLSGREVDIPIEEVPLLNILEQAVRTGSDHEKVKACSMRAIGNLLLLLEENHLKIEKFQKLVIDAATTLIYNASNENNMKVRWNACYSLRNMLRNTVLITQVSTNWIDNVLGTLLKLITSCSNFKVRQAAANALCAINNRMFYGSEYNKIWPVLMKAFENSQNLTEFSEFKHQRNLIDQLCLTFCHFCKFVQIEDLSDNINPLILSHSEFCIKYVSELKQRNVNVLINFEETVTRLKKLLISNLSIKQKETLDIMIEILNSNNDANIKK
ncbi:hypothetical protein PGB90_007860 [Kerria lacca]